MLILSADFEELGVLHHLCPLDQLSFLLVIMVHLATYTTHFAWMRMDFNTISFLRSKVGLFGWHEFEFGFGFERAQIHEFEIPSQTQEFINPSPSPHARALFIGYSLSRSLCQAFLLALSHSKVCLSLHFSSSLSSLLLSFY